MTGMFVRAVGVPVGLLAVALTLCALGAWSASADATAQVESGVVEAFIKARAAGDVPGVATLLDEHVRLVDADRDRSSGPDAFYQLFPPRETVAFGARSRAWDGSIWWTETVLDDRRPTWENNLNWWMDDTVFVGMSRSPGAKTYAREMRARVVEGKLTQITVVRSDAPSQELEVVRSDASAQR